MKLLTGLRRYGVDVFRSTRFLGGQQQDSYEVLRHLMDGVKEEHQELIEQQVCHTTAGV